MNDRVVKERQPFANMVFTIATAIVVFVSSQILLVRGRNFVSTMQRL